MSVLCITPNPALDRTLVMPRLHPGDVHGVERVIERAGGKGLNVARVVRQLGVDVMTLAPLGGPTGRRVADLAARERMAARWVEFDHADTRTCTIVVTDDGTSTVFNERGPDLGSTRPTSSTRSTSSTWSDLVAAARSLGAATDLGVVTISGSLPPGVNQSRFRALIDALREVSHAAIWVDASGDALHATFGANVSLKVNRHEARTALGAAHDEDAVALAARLRDLGGAAVIVTDGERGAVWACATGSVVTACPPPTAVTNATGSGDAFLAGVAVGLHNGLDEHATLRLAVAAGTTSAMAIDPGITPDRLAELNRQIDSHEVIPKEASPHHV